MTTTLERAEELADDLTNARATRRKHPGDGVTTYWAADMLDEGSAWIKANADILPHEIDASWRRMDNGPLLTLRVRNCADVVDALAAAYALSDRFGVGVSVHQPARLAVIGVSTERIRMNGFRVGGLSVDFSAAVRTAVSA